LKLIKTAQFLWEAVMKSNLHNVSVILENNFPPNAPLHITKLTALHYASCLGNLEIIYKLLQYGAKADFKDSNGRNALHYAAANGFQSVVKLLLDNTGISVNSQTIGGETALMKAIQFNKNEMAAFLLEKGADPLLANQLGQNSLDVAKSCQNQIALSLLEQNAVVLQQNQQQQKAQEEHKGMEVDEVNDDVDRMEVADETHT